MTTIEKLASALEDISIKDDTKEDEPQYVLPLEVDSESSLEDQQFEKLLDLIDQYESLSGGSFRLNHTNGRLNLTRANYNTGLIGKKYGYDAYDLRCYGSCKAVRLVNGEFKIIDKLKEKRERDRREKDTEKEKEKGKKEKTGEEENKIEDIGLVSGVSKIQSKTLKNRKDKLKVTATSTLEGNLETNRIVDPITQFGGLVPYQLRQSQQYFDNWLKDCIEMVNLQRKITNLLNEIEKQETTTETNPEKKKLEKT